MKPFIIIYRNFNRDNPIEIDLVYAETSQKAYFKWDNKDKQYVGRTESPISDGDVILFNSEYEKYKEENYKNGRFSS